MTWISQYGGLGRDMEKLTALKKAVEILGLELNVTKKSVEDVAEAWKALPPELKRAIGNIKISIELKASEDQE